MENMMLLRFFKVLFLTAAITLCIEIIYTMVVKTQTNLYYDVEYNTTHDIVISYEGKPKVKKVPSQRPHPDNPAMSSDWLVPKTEAERKPKVKKVPSRRAHPDNPTVSSDWLVPKTEAEYEKYVEVICQKEIQGKSDVNTSLWCPCIPTTLKGKETITELQLMKAKRIPWSDLNATLWQLEPGGLWRPLACKARRRVAIIIPYRDREPHLRLFLLYNVPKWQRQQIEFRIFVIEQGSPAVFNKGSLMNAGFVEVAKLYKFDCVLFHDVDMLSENDRNMVICGDRVIHHGAYVSKFNYRLIYFPIFGGAVSLTSKQYTTINGYSNSFYGWGGEDDNFFYRLNATDMGWFRAPKSIARYHMKKHRRDTGNPVLGSGPAEAVRISPEEDGLNNVEWKLKNITIKPFYTLIQMDLPEKTVRTTEVTTSR